MRFIPVDKIKKLREASRTGDERAKKILAMQLKGDVDFSQELDDYFKPQPEVTEKPATKLDTFLSDNGITKDSPDYQSYVDDFYKEFPEEQAQQGGEQCEECCLDDLIKCEIDAITSYQNTLLKIISEDGMNESTKKGIITDLEEIKKSKMDNLDKLKRMKSSMAKKVE